MQGAGISNPLLPSSIQYVINTVMTLPAIIFLDRWGRRPTLLAGSFVMMACLYVSGAIQGAYGQPAPSGSAITWELVNKPSQGKAVIAVSYVSTNFDRTASRTDAHRSLSLPLQRLGDLYRGHIQRRSIQVRFVPKQYHLQQLLAGAGILLLPLLYHRS